MPACHVGGQPIARDFQPTRCSGEVPVSNRRGEARDGARVNTSYMTDQEGFMNTNRLSEAGSVILYEELGTSAQLRRGRKYTDILEHEWFWFYKPSAMVLWLQRSDDDDSINTIVVTN